MGPLGCARTFGASGRLGSGLRRVAREAQHLGTKLMFVVLLPRRNSWVIQRRKAVLMILDEAFENLREQWGRVVDNNTSKPLTTQTARNAPIETSVFFTVF